MGDLLGSPRVASLLLSLAVLFFFFLSVIFLVHAVRGAQRLHILTVVSGKLSSRRSRHTFRLEKRAERHW